MAGPTGVSDLDRVPGHHVPRRAPPLSPMEPPFGGSEKTAINFKRILCRLGLSARQLVRSSFYQANLSCQSQLSVPDRIGWRSLVGSASPRTPPPAAKMAAAERGGRGGVRNCPITPYRRLRPKRKPRQVMSCPLKDTHRLLTASLD